MKTLLPPNLIKNLCREIMYEEKAKDAVLWYEGDSGKKYYIIISGEVKFYKHYEERKPLNFLTTIVEKENKKINKLNRINPFKKAMKPIKNSSLRNT